MKNANKRSISNKKIGILLLCAVIIMILIGYKLFMNNSSGELISGSLLPEVKDAKKLSEKDLDKLADQKVDETKFTLTIYPEAFFEDGSSEGQLYIKNEFHNHYPIAIELIENETGEILYESGAIHPGYGIETATLTKVLPKGKHRSTAKVSVYDPKTQKYQGQTEAEVTIHVKK
ncbi:hypothetical protein [Enterococcus faecalis]|uniref:hypothetical protein n=1 Tax=Enterococcus faecalis TaxID=1351 RepID=UPI001F33CB21|nr:hypothetical protein [Enterococcus faecalis]